MKNNSLNSNFTQQDESVLQQVDKITKLRVQLAKQQSKIQSYKQLEQNWKNNGVKTQALYRQTLFYQRKLNDYNKKIIQIAKLLNVNNLNMYQEYNQTPKFLEDSSQSYTQNNLYDSAYKRSMTRLNSLRSIAKFNNDQQQLKITDQQPKLNLILHSVIRLQKDNEQLQQNIKMYEQSYTHIQKNSIHQKYLKEEYENLIKQKQIQFQQKQLQIKNILKELQLKQSKIQQLENFVNELDQKMKKIQIQNKSLKNQLNQNLQKQSLEEKQREVKQKCQNLLAMLKINDDQYLKSYLGNHKFRFDQVQTVNSKKSKYELIFD